MAKIAVKNHAQTRMSNPLAHMPIRIHLRTLAARVDMKPPEIAPPLRFDSIRSHR